VLETPTFSPDGHLLAVVSHALSKVDLLSGEIGRPFSPTGWEAISPTYSPDGTHLIWLTDKAGGAAGPAELVYLRQGPIDVGHPTGFFVPTVIVGSHGRAFDHFPVRPDS
jgi:hypothetical protein